MDKASGEPLEALGEDELLRRAARAMARAAKLPVGSAVRAIQWAVYDQYAEELEERAITFVAGLARGDEGIR